MIRQALVTAALIATAAATHGGPHATHTDGACVAPGTCTPPVAKFSRVLGVTPRQQWNIAGGFCGSLSIQTAHLAFGAWISQDLVRKANNNFLNLAHGHCDGGQPGHPGQKKGLGCEVGAVNLGVTALGLKLDYELWDYNATKPQAPAYKKWMKSHLVKGHPIVWLVMCKGDEVCPYPGACPNGGSFGHVEPVWGIYSNHSLDDPEVYPNDVVVHSSDQDLNPYYRPFHTLQDSTKMDGNCGKAVPGFGHNEMYPCINDMTDYGLAINGIKGGGKIPVLLHVDSKDEPDTRMGAKPLKMKALVTATELTAGKKYELYRYTGTANLPTDGSTGEGAPISTFTAKAAKWNSEGLFLEVMSNTATYFRVFPAAKN